MAPASPVPSHRPSRRQFLRGALGTIASLPLAGSLLAQSKTPSDKPAAAASQEILVLGAGMSGLTAALSLHRAGHKVRVIEYQDRIGGRLLSVPLKGGQFSEAGGGHFRSNMPYVLSYIRASACRS